MKSIHERFWAKVDIRPGLCWLWLGRKDRKGYGYFDVTAKKPRPAHRVAFQLVNGDPANFAVCHKCDNPSCVNPTHLFLGTLADNNRDMREKGRGKNPPKQHRPGELSPTAKLSQAQAREIRASTEPQKLTAAKYGVSVSLVSMIQRGERWAHL